MGQGGRLVGMRVVLARCSQRDAVQRQARGQHGGQPREPLWERVVRLRIRHGTRVAVRGLEGDQLSAQAVHLNRDVACGPQPGVRGLVAHEPDCLEHPLFDLAPHPLAVEVVLIWVRDRRDRNLGGREGGREGVVERESLERVVLLTDPVEVPSEPAGPKPGRRRPDLPVVAGREVRLVGVGVADGGQHRHLLLGVELLEPAECRMPVETIVLGELCSAGERELWPELPVERIALR